MITHFKSRSGSAAALSKRFWAMLLLLPATAPATDYTWDGSTDFWNSPHWTPGLVNGPTAATDTATINTGIVTFRANDTFGAAGTTTSPVINLNGGTLASGGFFNTLINLNMNGGTLLSNGGVNSPFGAWGLKGTVTVGGTTVSNMTTTTGSNNTISIGSGIAGGVTTFNVADVTGSSASDLIAGTVFNNISNVQSGLVKSGAGTMQLNAVNTYTGDTVTTAGTLLIGSTGSIGSANRVSTIGGGTLAISGTLTMASGGVFSVGAGTTSTTGTTTVLTGGVLNLGTGGGYIGIGGKNSTGTSTGFGTAFGMGTLTVSGGTVNVAAGTATPTGASVGLDCSNLWMNPYGSTGASTINLDGGVLSTARTIQNGSSNAVFNFNGGIFRAAAAVTMLGFNSAVRNGGAIIDTNGFAISSGVAYLHSAIGGDNAIDGGFTKQGANSLTLTSAGSTFTGNVLVSAGSLTATGSSNTPTPTATVLGDMTTAGKTVTVASGATLAFGNNDTLGSTVSNPAPIILNGGTLNHNTFFITTGNITLNNAATMTGGNGVVGTFQTWNLRGSVTVGGTGGSLISTSGTTNTGIHLGVNGTNDFIVNSTGSAVDLTVSVPLLDRPGNNVGPGVLRKSGAGTMVLTAANAYTGSTTVDGGKLFVNGSLTASSAVAVAAGATLGGTGTVGGTATVAAGGIIEAGQSGSGALTLGGLTFSSGGSLAFGSATNYTATPGINVTTSNGLVANGAAGSLLFTFSGGLSTGTYKLVSYSGSIGGTGQSAFTLGVLPGRAAGALDFGTAGLIQLNVTGIDSIIWTGANSSNWSTSTEAPNYNWKLNSNNANTDFLANDIVNFTDSAANKSVNISGGNVTPASVTFNNSTGNDYTLGGASGIAGAASLTKTGTGKITINNANSFTGGTTLTNGTITLGNANPLGTGLVTINGGTLDTNGFSVTIGDLAGNGGIVTNNAGAAGTILVNPLASTTYGGTLQNGSGTLALTKQGAGTQILTGNHTFTGGTTVSGGTLQLGDGTTNGSVAGNILTNATLAFANPSGQTFAGIISGTGNLTKSGAGTLSLSGVNVHTGLTSVSNGMLSIASGGALNGTSSVLATNGATLNVESGGNITTLKLNDTAAGLTTISGTVTVGPNGNFGIGSGVQDTTGTLVVNSGGILNVGGGSGATVGYVAIGGSDSGGAGGKGSGTLTINSGGTVNVAAGGTGPGGLDGSNLWFNPYGFSAANPTSTINLSGGTLSSARQLANGSGGTALLNFDGGTLRTAVTNTSGGFIGVSRANIRNGGGTIDTNGFDLRINQALLHSNIGGDNAIDGGLTKIGNGNLTLAGAGSYNGNLTISAGTLTDVVSANNASPAASGLGDMTVAGRTITVATGAKLVLGASDALGSYQYKTPVVITVNGTLENGVGTFGSIGDIVLNNGGRINTVNGAAAGFQVMNLRGSITVSGSAAASITTTGTTNNGLHLGGTSIAATTFNVGVTGNPTADLTVSAPLLDEVNVGAGALTKTGLGTMILNAANTYTGATTVNQGTLLVNGSLASTNPVTVANTAAFGRTATGTYTVGSLTFGSTAGDTSSFLTTPTSMLTVGATNGLFTNGGASSVTINVGGSAPAVGTYTLINYDGSIGGTGFPAFTLGTLPVRTLAVLVNNTTDTSVDLNVTGVDAARWSGALSSSWTTNTLAAPKNWVLHSNGTTQTDFITADTTYFTDSAVNGSVNINDADVLPTAVNVSNSTLAYTFGGTFAIAGSTGLTKSGTAGLSLTTPNTYTGTTALNGGTTTVVNNALGSGNITFGGGTLRYATGNTQDLAARFANSTSPIAIDTNSNTVTYASAINATNTGGLAKSGAGTLNLASNASTFTGDVNITGGTVALTAGQLGPATTTSALGNPTVARTVTIGAGARLEFKQHDILGNDGANPQLTIVVNGGTLAAVTGSQASGNGPFNILPTINLNGGTLTSANGAFAPVQSLSLKGDIIVMGSTISTINTTGTPALFNGIHLTKVGGVTFDVADVTGDAAPDLIVSAPLIDRAQGGAGSLNKNGAGTMALNEPATYTGTTTINGGTLLLGVTNALPANAALSLSTGATLNTGGFSDNTGALSVNGAANIDTAAGTGTLNFTAVTAWSAMLNIWNYTGAPWTPGTDKITFTNAAGIDFNNVNFYSGPVGDTASLIGTGGGGLIGNELVPVPEPGAVAGGVILLGVIAGRERRRRARFSR